MNTKQFHRRVWAIVLLLALMVTGMGAALYDLQINNGESYSRLTEKKIAETQSVPAARGNLYDRNGQVLVSNRVIYEVTLDAGLMKEEERCGILLSLIEAARTEGVEWTDNLPITRTAPFRFTTDDPYYAVSQDEDGKEVKTLTRLGRLAVKMGWVDDPTKEAEPETETAAPAKEPGLLDKIKSFLKGGASADVPKKAKEPKPLLEAEALLGVMCESFGVAGEGAVDRKKAAKNGETVPNLNIGDMSETDARALAGVLYELNLRSQDIYTAAEYVFASDVDIDFISRVKERDLTGVVIEAATLRQYHTKYAAHLLGRTGLMDKKEWEYYKTVDADGDGKTDYQMNDTVGKEGAEQAFESLLRGKPGTRTVERNTKGKIVAQNWETEPEPGGNVMLTLDIGLQGYVENLLADAVPKLASEETEGAACVVLDVKGAEVLTAASYPTYDLANYASELTEKGDDPLHPFLNRALQGAYPPGSTFKMLTAIAGLEEKIITPSTLIRDEGQYNYYGPNGPKCWIFRQYGSRHGLINVSKAIEVSCNYFMFDVGRQLGIEKLDEYAARFGLGEKTGIELAESAGVMASPEYTESLGGTWYEGNTLSVAIGQESSQFTPLQLANYIATLVNGGTRNAVHLLKEVKSSDFSQVLQSYEPQVLDTIEIEDQNLKAVKAGMLALTTNNSSVRQYFQSLPFQAGAKTGSAQVTGQNESNAVFVCFAPYDDPEIAVAIAVEHGGSGSELASMAADVLRYYFSSQETRDEIPVENTLIR
ncbi:MAG: penicillin-binding protein [Lawsonibacter sp.]|jgi:penicillin-binding protein 2|nr:penicillin-binding protein [Lawsonibacter sp.]